MAGITLEQAEEKLTLWMSAEDAVAAGQSYSVQGRSLSRANLGEIRESINYWEGKVNRLGRGGNGGIRVRGLTKA